MNNNTLCEIHDLIVNELEELKDCISLENEAEEKMIDTIISYVLVAKEKGQSMEDRLVIYREAIEELGFVRVYDK